MYSIWLATETMSTPANCRNLCQINVLTEMGISNHCLTFRIHLRQKAIMGQAIGWTGQPQNVGVLHQVLSTTPPGETATAS